VAIKNLWAGFGGKCETDNDGDPTVLYDDAADRWVISQFAIGGDGYQCVAVSTTNDPAGSYYRYAFLVSPGRTNDYPKMGIWPDGYYVTYNEFTSSFQGAVALSFERAKMLAGQPAQMVKIGPLRRRHGSGGRGSRDPRPVLGRRDLGRGHEPGRLPPVRLHGELEQPGQLDPGRPASGQRARIRRRVLQLQPRLHRPALARRAARPERPVHRLPRHVPQLRRP
jgi:hypothetical protein